MSLGVAPVNFKVAELFCRNRIGDAAADMGFERGLVLDYAIGSDMEDEEQVKAVELRVMEKNRIVDRSSCVLFLWQIDRIDASHR